MNRILTIFSAILIVGSFLGIYAYAKSQGIDVLEPQGYISANQRDLFYIALGLGLVALIPVFVMTFVIIQRYHVGNKKAEHRYSRNWQVKAEASWLWAIFVSFIIAILAVIMFRSTIAVDPYKPLTTDQPSKVIRVVALPWKWLFIYPEEGIASVNELALPINQPVTFELTADAPMSSFWIPKLGGMIYAMEGMVTKLNLMATSTGEYQGKNAEINGQGYSGMNFTTKALSAQDYQAWVDQVKLTGGVLNNNTYQALAKRSTDHPVQKFSSTDPAIFGTVLSKFMDPSHQDHNSAASDTNTNNHSDHQAH